MAGKDDTILKQILEEIRAVNEKSSAMGSSLAVLNSKVEGIVERFVKVENKVDTLWDDRSSMRYFKIAAGAAIVSSVGILVSTIHDKIVGINKSDIIATQYDQPTK